MSLSQQLSTKLQQKLTPQQIQVANLLECNLLELEQKVKEQLEDNPAIEEDLYDDEKVEDEEGLSDDALYEDFNDGDGASDSDDGDSMRDDGYEVMDLPDDNYVEYPWSDYDEIPDDRNADKSATLTFAEYLAQQLDERYLAPLEKKLCLYLINSLDDEGLLTRNVSEIAEDINTYNTSANVTDVDIYKALEIVQSLEPAGVGARSVAESLRLQVERVPVPGDADDIIHQAAEAILDEYFDDFLNKRFAKIERELTVVRDDKISPVKYSEFEEAVALIKKMNPHPANLYTENNYTKAFDAITPDFVYESEGGTLTLCQGYVPKIKVSKDYENSLSRMDKKSEEAKYVKQKIEEASQFVGALKQRGEKMKSIMGVIVRAQKDFFHSGDDGSIKPLTMQQVADKAGCDISLVSRMANNKFIQTDFGTFPIKHFFSERLSTAGGEEVSTRKIKSIISELVESENKSEPLTDDAIAETLQKKGFNVARRTVAKYREQLNISVARLRKE